MNVEIYSWSGWFMWRNVNLVHTLTSVSWQSVLMWHNLCHKLTYQVQKEFYFSCCCLWFMCQLEFAPRYQAYYLNGKPYHGDTPQMWSTVHAAWMNYSFMVTRKSINNIFDIVKWNVRSRRQETQQTNWHLLVSVCWKKMSEWVTLRERMIGRKAQPHPLRWLQRKRWLMSCFTMWLLFIVRKYFWFVIFVPFFLNSFLRESVSKVAPS